MTLTEEQIEAKFIAQEHRILRIVLNLIKFLGESRSDVRRKAAIEAFIWNFFNPASGRVAGIYTPPLATPYEIAKSSLLKAVDKRLKYDHEKQG
jgi:hypothetical protein